MRTDLDHLPPRKQHELARVVETIHDEFANIAPGTSQWKRRGRIRAIILYGSYARGDWVDEYHTGRGYRSDYDLLVIVSHAKLTDSDVLGQPLTERLMHESVSRPLVSVIVHTLAEINDALARGRYFFVDIYCEGIELYRTKDTRLATPQPLSPDLALEMAEENAAFWLENADTSLKYARIGFAASDLRKSAFELHQATESLYGALLLTLTNYMPSTHNLNKLRGLAEGYEASLIDVWPRLTRAERKPFNKLVDAYVKARYSRHYRIDVETLHYLIGRIEQLRERVEAACRKRIAELKAATKSDRN